MTPCPQCAERRTKEKTMLDLLAIFTSTLKFLVNLIFDQFAAGSIDWILGHF